MTKLYAEISKMEAQDDGTIKVWGYASSETVDSDGETITADAMKAAIPDYMKFGAVREMHGKSAAGTAIEINVEDDGRTFFGAHVVDPVAVKKVQTGVYKGFSIGGSVTGRDELNKSVIKGIKLTEISLVDRPANPDAVFTCFKADKGDDMEDADDKDDDADDAPSEKPDADDKDDDNVKDKDKAAEKAAFPFSDAEIAALKKMLKAAQAQEQADEKAEKADDSDGIAKTADAEELAKVQDERDSALAELEALKKQAEKPKAVLKAVSKAEDNGATDDPLNGFQPIVKHDGTLDEAATLVKAAQTGRL